MRILISPIHIFNDIRSKPHPTVPITYIKNRSCNPETNRHLVNQ